PLTHVNVLPAQRHLSQEQDLPVDTPVGMSTESIIHVCVCVCVYVCVRETEPTWGDEYRVLYMEKYLYALQHEYHIWRNIYTRYSMSIIYGEISIRVTA